jgi:hypothetical protein
MCCISILTLLVNTSPDIPHSMLSLIAWSIADSKYLIFKLWFWKLRIYVWLKESFILVFFKHIFSSHIIIASIIYPIKISTLFYKPLRPSLPYQPLTPIFAVLAFKTHVVLSTYEAHFTGLIILFISLLDLVSKKTFLCNQELSRFEHLTPPVTWKLAHDLMPNGRRRAWLMSASSWLWCNIT